MPRAVLGLDTSGTWCSVALTRADRTIACRVEVGNAHSTYLLPMVDAVLRDADLPLDACDAIAFGAGPGSFTGLRVACAAAQGLAFGASLPVVPVGTLAAIGHSVRDDVPDGTVVVAQDARMGEVYWSVLSVTNDRIVVIEPPAVSLPRDVRPRWEAHPGWRRDAVGVGNAWAIHGEALDGLVDRVVFRAAADAVDVARLGLIAFEEGRAVPADRAAPSYVRDDVARTTAQRAADRASTA